MFKRPLILSLILLLALVLPVSAQDTARNQTYSGLLDNVVPEKSYTVELFAGDNVLIETDTPDSELDTVLTLYNEAGVLVAENDDRSAQTFDSAIMYQVPTSGIYEIVVSRYDATTSGAFELLISFGGVEIFVYEVAMSGERLTFDTEHFRIHYTYSGSDATTEAYVVAMAEALELSWRVQIEELGYNPPPRDGLMGGNDLYDVFVLDLIGSGEGAIGYASPQNFIGDNPDTPQIERFAATSYLAIDASFADADLQSYQTRSGLMRATVAHEFHHAVQFGYDAREPHDWMNEATSTWMEVVTVGAEQDATGYIEYTYTYPELCFGTDNDPNDGLLMYGDWAFMEHLGVTYGRQIVRELWENVIDLNGFAALEATLSAYDSSITDEVSFYRLRNLARDYDLAPLFGATVWLEDTITGTGFVYDGLGVEGLGANYFAFTPQSIFTAEVTPVGAGDLEVWAVGIINDKIEAFWLGAGGAFDSRGYDDFYLMVINVDYDEDVSNCAYVNYDLRITGGGADLRAPAWVTRGRYFERLSN